MVSPIIKTLGAVVVGTPVAVVLGLTARSIRKQEDASVPVVRTQEAPLSVTVYSNYLDKRTHEHLPPTSFKKGYVAYDVHIENHSAEPVKGVHVELLDIDGDVVGTHRLGEVEAYGQTVFSTKRSWTSALEASRSRAVPVAPRTVLTWRTPLGRRRTIVSPAVRRVLGPTPSSVRQSRRRRPPVLAQVMS
ncbi:hypothetical protein AX769_20020 [Frondihabitans sp. PAMC 28766]|uniref:hypothetical protein n=1 Tax=Frondihabitans sp. PAMC 28766 TaxID=1795630 RepID=UPI00078D4689|nr:hypothetical protein [Frondihabitans sp. PAMC 28766]AMM22015.1 hypothetical protein AX769_20020 [Frondihabitans sp. PAMC 28766]